MPGYQLRGMAKVVVLRRRTRLEELQHHDAGGAHNAHAREEARCDQQPEAGERRGRFRLRPRRRVHGVQVRQDLEEHPQAQPHAQRKREDVTTQHVHGDQSTTCQRTHMHEHALECQKLAHVLNRKASRQRWEHDVTHHATQRIRQVPTEVQRHASEAAQGHRHEAKKIEPAGQEEKPAAIQRLAPAAEACDEGGQEQLQEVDVGHTHGDAVRVAAMLGQGQRRRNAAYLLKQARRKQ
mmetsp:Transcript_30972/g.89197  ORF Transcript_30972/g.89197 Transcript_30972/m.89197 type:complete len:238 (+) Transcript_30972:718-1431(+)